MGGDGGVMANQRRFTRGCEKDTDIDNSKKNIKEEQRLRSSTCAQSSQPLSSHIVIDELGNLYNKDVLIQSLISKTLVSSCNHIRGLKDVKDAIFTYNNDDNNDEKRSNTNRFICPVTRVEFNGSLPFVLIWSTGYVLSDKAIREVGIYIYTIHSITLSLIILILIILLLGIESLQSEYGPFNETDIIKLIPRDDELVQLKNDMKIRRENALNDKKRKRDTKNDNTNSNTNANSNSNSNSNNKSSKKEEKKEEKYNKMSTINSASAIAQAAISAIKRQEEKSDVFKNMFGK